MVTKAQVLKRLKAVIDPELGIDIVSLGLIYDVKIEGKNVHITMTMTTPFCPLLQPILRDVEQKTKDLKDVEEVLVELVWDPPWTPERISPAIRKKFGMR